MKIRLHPINKEIEGDSNRSLLQLCHDNKVELKSLCKGVPSCAECRVRILAGDANVIPPNKAELSLIGTSYYIDGRRLACQIRAFGDISVDITEHLKEDDTTNKKIRGFRPPPGQTRESKAVQGTLVLQEPAAETPVRRGAGGRGAGPASDRGRQVRHPGDEFVAGSEHVETLDAADLDGSGDEGVIDPTLVDGDIYAGDDGDTSEAIIHDLAERESTPRGRDDEDDFDEDEDEDSDDAETENRPGASTSSDRSRSGPPRGGGPRGPQRGPRPPGGGPGSPSKNAGPSGEGGGQKRRRRRGGRGRRGGGGGGGAPTPKT